MKKLTRIVNIDEAKARLSELVDQAAEGEPFSNPPQSARRLGFMKGQIAIPEDFDRMGGFDN